MLDIISLSKVFLSVFLTVGVVVFVLVTFYMWKVDEFYNKYKPSFLKEWCIHCMSFWLSMIISIVYVSITKEYYFLVVPFASTPFSVLLYNSIMN